MRRRDARRALRTLVSPGEYDTDKGGSGSPYLDAYDEWFAPLADAPIGLFELGVRRGGSLALWRDYFIQGTIVGLDMNAVELNDSSGRIHVYRGFQDDIPLLDRIAGAHAPDGFDIIIDDCAHIGRIARRTFWHLFEHHLKPGGIYAIEDFGTGYMPQWPDGGHFLRPERLPSRVQPQEGPSESSADGGQDRQIPSHMYGMVGFVKELVDACCLNGIMKANWGEDGAHRHSKVERVLIAKNLALVRKDPRANTLD